MVKMDDIRIVWILENKGLMVYLVILFWHSWGSVQKTNYIWKHLASWRQRFATATRCVVVRDDVIRKKKAVRYREEEGKRPAQDR